MKVYLKVPYSEKGLAKSMGAFWDPEKKMWYAPYGEKGLISRWATNKEASVFKLNGEDLSFGGNSLFVDLIPKSCWFTNVRTAIAQEDWYRIKDHIHSRVSNKCECCASMYNLEAHERWKYDISTKTQKLMRIISLCINVMR